MVVSIHGLGVYWTPASAKLGQPTFRILRGTFSSSRPRHCQGAQPVDGDLANDSCASLAEFTYTGFALEAVGGQVVPDVLLVVAGLILADLDRGGPEARAVGGQNLVDKDDFVLFHIEAYVARLAQGHGTYVAFHIMQTRSAALCQEGDKFKKLGNLPNSILVSAITTPRSSAYACAALYTLRARASIWLAYLSPIIFLACSGEMFSSFSPAGALVDGC